jgi:hypothetical protein
VIFINLLSNCGRTVSLGSLEIMGWFDDLAVEEQWIGSVIWPWKDGGLGRKLHRQSMGFVAGDYFA